jgi:N6-adenosine-specific RNA methylase IME4
VKPSGFTPFSWQYSTELCLFARRGGLALERMGLRLDLSAPQGTHSTKPVAFYDLVAAASPEPRLEMFARTNRDGFVPWGA